MASEVRDSLELYVAFQLAELEGCLPLVAAGDQEAVHNSRLALRRLRSVLGYFGQFLPPVPVDNRRDIRWLAASLGESRDDYVLAQRMTLRLGANWRSPEALQAAVTNLVERSDYLARSVAGNPRARSAVDATARAVFPEPAPPKRQPGPDVRQAILLLQAGRQGLREQLALATGATAGTSRNELLHQARKDVKRLRYALEAVAGPVGTGSTTVLRPAMILQRVLGEQHDCVAALAWIDSLTAKPGVSASDVEQLRRMEHQRLAEAEAALRDAIQGTPIPEPLTLLTYQPAQESSGTLPAEESPGQSYLAM
ncbi:CHAD domain-containing protein [Paenarthrobacter sp. NPDC089675]|uniref:CHAD domain-containing protein n=1 Tax=Paenarthrobacter sp. NPDC089675 TaxID=3364376 RepID=UPI00381A2B4C